MRVPSGGSGVAQEVRDCVVFPFYVLACETVGAVDNEACELMGDQLYGFVIKRARLELAGFVKPTDGGSVVPEREYAVLLATEFFAFEDGQPNGDYHPEELEDAVRNIDSVDRARLGDSDSPSSPGEQEPANAEGAGVRPTEL